MTKSGIVPILLALSLLAGCAGGPGGGYGLRYYHLVEPGPEEVARGSMVVTPTIRWNKAPRGPDQIQKEEDWTLNGPLLDGLTFIGALENDKRIVQQRRKADRKVPNFRSDMSPPEIGSMIESFYRVRAGASEFNVTGLSPRDFAGRPGFQFDYDYLGGDEVWRRGRAVGAIVEGRLYLALLDAARAHYFGAALPEFERIVESARIRR
ncbi:MAG: hypothetical protein QOG72_3256 [Sphingomonadales bacterium]|jgi:hypothetical protein|nr:hypothetical protein [Sphingomonadales bacterium]